ncbi:MAG: PAN domain-containing protein [Xanthobacteraceae bacterium]|nr:PAN domain-containing protein [Xanthobacteraceae bacterium]MBV9235305.1 PAN domain-containing protein [Xanthobacteraceae bacterium]MBV9626908.1 PAN domain-containing protein [Xanthobacteraceae bacterium]
MRSLFWIVGVVALLLAGSESRAQVGVDRPGGDYLNFDVRPADPAICAARCEREARCRAWTFAYPTPENPSGICWLKSGVPPRVQAPCCISGIRGAGVIEPRGGPLEYSIDRFGGDYRNFDMQPDPTASACKAACEADSKCRAWTYLRPGYAGPAARCFLKNQVKAPRRRPCCISGVVR